MPNKINDIIQKKRIKGFGLVVRKNNTYYSNY